MKEMNKPLARYVGDKDLDDYLKAQEREGDPMLDYIKQKQSEATALTGGKWLIVLIRFNCLNWFWYC